MIQRGWWAGSGASTLQSWLLSGLLVRKGALSSGRNKCCEIGKTIGTVVLHTGVTVCTPEERRDSFELTTGARSDTGAES